MTSELHRLRSDFERQAGRSLALPIAGSIIWTVIAVTGLMLPESSAIYVLVFGTGLIFPVGLIAARALGERLFGNDSPLAALMGQSVLMVNLLWVVHLTLLFTHPSLVPLSIAVTLGIHWVVFSWIIGHPVGIVHALLRTVLVTTAWWLVPEARIFAVSLAVVASYAYAIVVLATRTRPSISRSNATPGHLTQARQTERHES